jgi:hypothetical protein
MVLRRIISRRMKVAGREIMWGIGESWWKGTRRRGVRTPGGSRGG